MIPRQAIAFALLVWSSAFVAAETIHVPADHPEIQAAIDAAQDGDVVLVSAGTYVERVRLKAGVFLKSEGDDARGKVGLLRAERTVIDGGGEGEFAGVAMAAGATLDGFTVTNIGTFDAEKWNKHHTTQGNEQSHEHIGAPGVPGVAITGVSCVLRHNIVHDNGYSGIAITGVEDKRCAPLISDNVCFRNMGAGIASMHGSTATISSNRCYENFYAGIGHNDASPTVTGNTCFANLRAGIGISEGACPVVRGNRCYGNRRAGIGTRTGAETRPLIENNDCYENDMAGIGTDEGADPIIRRNRCYKNKLAGIGVRGRSAPKIIENECYENTLAGIGLAGAMDAMVFGNHSHHNGTAGIGFATCKEGRALVDENRFIDNATVAAGVHPGWRVQFTENTLSREGGMPPIVMVFAGSEAIFTGNTIRGGGVAGIRVAGTLRAEGNKILGAAMRKAGPPNFAVWALEGAKVRLSNNEIRSWRHALVADKAEVEATDNKVRDYHGEAFVVREPSAPPQVTGNDVAADDH